MVKSNLAKNCRFLVLVMNYPDMIFLFLAKSYCCCRSYCVQVYSKNLLFPNYFVHAFLLRMNFFRKSSVIVYLHENRFDYFLNLYLLWFCSGQHRLLCRFYFYHYMKLTGVKFYLYCGNQSIRFFPRKHYLLSEKQHRFCILYNCRSSSLHSKASYYKCADRNTPKDNSTLRLNNCNFHNKSIHTNQTTNIYCTKDQYYILIPNWKAHNRREISDTHNYDNHRGCNMNHLVHYMLTNRLPYIRFHLHMHNLYGLYHTQLSVYNSLPATAMG